MCLILLAWQAHPRYRLVVAANRDEFFARPSAPAGFWNDHPLVLAGRDLDAGGTWLGITRNGRFAAITNFRNPAEKKPGAPTRGALVSGYLTGTEAPLAYLTRVASSAPEFNGFNLLVGDGNELYCLSNRAEGVERLAAGVHGLSNHLLNTPWPKVQRGKAALTSLLDAPFSGDELLEMLGDTAVASESALPVTGVSPDWERQLSPMRIVAGAYGTRCSTAITFADDGDIRFWERSYSHEGSAAATVHFHLPTANQPFSQAGATSPRAESLLRQTHPPAG
ncbi:MAG: NRDE family protein [Betaproteobacteria bacterium]|nr:NRDE family protein [Betaproteobacteria bacterium]